MRSITGTLYVGWSCTLCLWVSTVLNLSQKSKHVHRPPTASVLREAIMSCDVMTYAIYTFDVHIVHYKWRIAESS